MTQKLLVVDENSTIQRVIKLAFKDEAIQVVTVPRGRDALQQIESDPPDIVLADNGREVAAFMKTRPALAGIPVVLLKGAFDEPGDGTDDARGCDAVLMKPLQPDAMIDRVKRLLSRRRTPAAEKRPLPLAPPAAVVDADAYRPDSELELDRYFDTLAAAFSSTEHGASASSLSHLDQGLVQGWMHSMFPPGAAPAAQSGRAPDPGATPKVNAKIDASSEQLIELITQRVLDRLADRVTRATAAELVARLSRWLLVDEVERSRA